MKNYHKFFKLSISEKKIEASGPHNRLGDGREGLDLPNTLP